MLWVLYIFVYIINMIATINYLYVMSVVFRRLQERYPDVFREMGSPHLFKNNNPGLVLHIWKFVVRGGHRRLHDPDVDRLCSSARWSVGTVVFLLLGVVVRIVFSIA